MVWSFTYGLSFLGLPAIETSGNGSVLGGVGSRSIVIVGGKIGTVGTALSLLWELRLMLSSVVLASVGVVWLVPRWSGEWSCVSGVSSNDIVATFLF